MDTRPITPARLAESVIAVPPLARDAQGKVDPVQNGRIFRHIEGGGVDILLYGGNAHFYHSRPSEFGATLEMLAGLAGVGTLNTTAGGPAVRAVVDYANIAEGPDVGTRK